MASPAPTLLIVDDEEALLRVAARLLEKAGYRVLVAHNGVEGLDLWHQRRPEIALILSDVSMPRMGGHDLLERVRAEAPDLPFIVMSGEPEGEAEYLERFTRVQLMTKPWEAAALLAVIRDLVPLSPG
jgi:two-component system cell cycle sensor histidine kinase/response regulator CckA